jgi:hypothetical protein
VVFGASLYTYQQAPTRSARASPRPEPRLNNGGATTLLNGAPA